MSTREIPDWRMDLMRNAGAFICHCLHPVRIHLMLWGADECARCGRKIA